MGYTPQLFDKIRTLVLFGWAARPSSVLMGYVPLILLIGWLILALSYLYYALLIYEHSPPCYCSLICFPGNEIFKQSVHHPPTLIGPLILIPCIGFVDGLCAPLPLPGCLPDVLASLNCWTILTWASLTWLVSLARISDLYPWLAAQSWLDHFHLTCFEIIPCIAWLLEKRHPVLMTWTALIWLGFKTMTCTADLFQNHDLWHSCLISFFFKIMTGIACWTWHNQSWLVSQSWLGLLLADFTPCSTVLNVLAFGCPVHKPHHWYHALLTC